MTLREAALRTGRSITTLRRYIRGGRLRAELRDGRFGSEYAVRAEDLADAGLPARSEQMLVPVGPAALQGSLRDAVPLPLYHELQMKHEQLLVQYGMMRAGGLRVLELQAELEARQRQLATARDESARLQERLAREGAQFRKRLREAELELEGRALEIAALREKVRGLELLTRNAVTNETIERQFSAVMAQARRVDQLSIEAPDPRPGWPERPPGEPEH